MSVSLLSSLTDLFQACIAVTLKEYNSHWKSIRHEGALMDIQTIKNYYTARGLQWPCAKDALWFFLSEVGELAEAYLAHHAEELTAEEIEMLKTFSAEGFHADEIVSRVQGWIRNNDRVKKEDISKEVADCEMMLSVFMYSQTQSTPDEALLKKMKEKLGGNADVLAGEQP